MEELSSKSQVARKLGELTSLDLDGHLESPSTPADLYQLDVRLRLDRHGKRGRVAAGHDFGFLPRLVRHRGHVSNVRPRSRPKTHPNGCSQADPELGRGQEDVRRFKHRCPEGGPAS